MSLLPKVDPFTGIKEEYSYDNDKKALIIKRTQNVQEIIDFNRMIYNDPPETWRKDPEKFMLFARIPNIVIEQWLKEDPPLNVFLARMGRDGKPNDHMQRLLRRLEDPDWRYLKTTPLRMG